MKQFLILFLAASLFISCKDNNKSNRERENERREKDDYRTQESKEETGDVTDTKTTNFSSNGDWSDADIRSFNKQCLESMDNNEEVANKVCPCALEKFKEKYSSLAEMDKKSTEAEGKRIGEECVAEVKGEIGNNNTGLANNGWPEVEKTSFTKNCVTNAMAGGQTKLVAEGYCDCMLSKMQQLYPDINDAGKLTEAQINRIAAKYAAGCLEEH
jgi:hypothetical protein